MPVRPASFFGRDGDGCNGDDDDEGFGGGGGGGGGCDRRRNARRVAMRNVDGTLTTRAPRVLPPPHRDVTIVSVVRTARVSLARCEL